MSDPADDANETSDFHLQTSINRSRQAASSPQMADRLPRTGLCHNCDEPIAVDALFCDDQCSADWHKRQSMHRARVGRYRA
jgi:RNA polymerase-binding transcription factor DksA